MRNEVYKRHIDNFSKHWWFQARKKIIETTISFFWIIVRFMFLDIYTKKKLINDVLHK